MSGSCGENMTYDHVGAVVLAIRPWSKALFSRFVYATEL